LKIQKLLKTSLIKKNLSSNREVFFCKITSRTQKING